MRGSKVDMKILTILWNKIKYFKGHYVNPSQVTFGKWLCNPGGLDVCRRTFNRYMRTMQNSAQISRIRRVRRDPKKGLVFETTLYALAYLGLQLLYQTGVITWDELKAYIRHSAPFRARQAKKGKKGLTPGDADYYKDFTFSGVTRANPI